jgi:5,10-methylenetetrahydromethanopterin reductase
MVKQRMAIYTQAKMDMKYELDMARYAEDRGFSEFWNSDSGLARDAIVMMSAFLTHTEKLKIGSAVLPIWTRNAAVIASSWSTMWELGKANGCDENRVMLGLGAWFEPICTRVGRPMVRPLKAMREYVEAIRGLLNMERVTCDGEFVHLEDMGLDPQSGHDGVRDIPILIGATGDKMLEMAGEVADGVVLNYLMSVERIKYAISLVEKGAKKAGRSLKDLDLPELINVSLSDKDPEKAIFEGKKYLANALILEPHHRAHVGASEELIQELQARIPYSFAPTPELEQNAHIVPEELVRKVMAVGTAEDCRAKVRQYVDAGVTCPIMYPLMGDIKALIDAFADGF